MGEKKEKINSPKEVEAIRSNLELTLYIPSLIPLNGKIFVQKETANDIVTKAGIFLGVGTNEKVFTRYYVVAISEDCKLKELGCEAGDEVVPFMGSSAIIEFQAFQEVINDKIKEFGVMWESELGGFRKNKRTVKWEFDDKSS